jgi:putative transposase
MCRVLRASRSGFYAWLLKPLSDRAVEDHRLLRLIRASYAASGGVYGSPRVFQDLREIGETCGKHCAPPHEGQQNQSPARL